MYSHRSCFQFADVSWLQLEKMSSILGRVTHHRGLSGTEGFSRTWDFRCSNRESSRQTGSVSLPCSRRTGKMNPWDLKNTLNVRKFAIGTGNFSYILYYNILQSVWNFFQEEKQSDSSYSSREISGSQNPTCLITHENMEPREVKGLKQH